MATLFEGGELRETMKRRITAIEIVAVVAVLIAVWLSIRPSADRDWAVDQERFPRATVVGSTVVVENVRAFDHCPAGGGEAVRRWERRTYDLRDLDSVWLALSVFGQVARGPAHPFLSFQFGDTSFVAVSVEARRERGETYSVAKGMLKRFELMYVFADERDILELRAVCRNDRLYLYPIATSTGTARRLFLRYVEDENRLREHPEFYHTLWNNCTTRILNVVNADAARPIPRGLYTFLPGYSDRVVLSQGLIDAKGEIGDLRNRFRINGIVRSFAGRPDFSVAVRDSLLGGVNGAPRKERGR